MKARLLLPVLLVALSLIPAIGQPQPGQTLPAAGFPPRVQSQPGRPKLTTFSLDFPGGTPKQLVTAIEKAMGKPLNAIIPVEYDSFKLPPLKMNNVNVWQLFQALELTSKKTEKVVTSPDYGAGRMGRSGPSESYQFMATSYGFRTPDSQPDILSDDSIWYFYVEKPATPTQPVIQKVCRFYALTSYLERGLTVDDITTAIQTGWGLLGALPGHVETPTISFHKETKLLIAVGDPAKLETIDGVLKALTPPPSDPFFGRSNRRFPNDGTGLVSPPPAKPAEKPKTEN